MPYAVQLRSSEDSGPILEDSTIKSPVVRTAVITWCMDHDFLSSQFQVTCNGIGSRWPTVIRTIVNYKLTWNGKSSVEKESNSFRSSCA